MKCFNSWRDFLFRYFVEFELFVMFSFVPTRKPAKTVAELILVFMASMSFLNASLRFFLSISYYTGSLWLTSFCILAAFFLPNEIFIILFEFVAVCSYLQGLMVFMCLQKLKL